MSRSSGRRVDSVEDGFFLPIPIQSRGLSFYPQGDSNEHYELQKEQIMSSFIRKLAEDNPGTLALSTPEKYSQSAFLGLESVDEEDENDEDSFFDDSDDLYYEDDDGDDDDSSWTRAMFQFQKYGSYASSEGNGPFDSKFNFGMPHVLQRLTDEEANKNASELMNEEQRAKTRAVRRRLKKKRQKERKRQEKLQREQENINVKESLSENNSNSDEGETIKSNKQDVSVLSEKGSSPASKKKSPEGKKSQDGNKKIHNGTNENDSREEDELDMSSSFVSSAASSVKRKMDIKLSKPEKEKSAKATERKKETIQNNTDIEAAAKKSVDLAILGNTMAIEGHYSTAVNYFTGAITYNPQEHRLFGNRSYCYERLQQYSKALSDAEVGLSLCPDWPKGYFRKGRALTGLKRYSEAITAFREVLRIDNTCEDAEQELLGVQILLLMEMGFNREKSEDALKKYGTIEKVLEMSAPLGSQNRKFWSLESLSISNGEFINTNVPNRSKVALIPALLNTPKPLKSKDSNVCIVAPQQPVPRQLYPVWVGNVTKRITKELLLTHFQRAGPIYSMRILSDRYCAFINYSSKEAAERAFALLQGFEIEGTKFVLQLKHPDHATKPPGGFLKVPPKVSTTTSTAKTDGRETVKLPQSLECHFWRTATCANGNNCRFQHIPEHKGIDITTMKK